MARVVAAVLSAALCLLATDSACAQRQQVLVLVQNAEGIGAEQFMRGFQSALDDASERVDWFVEALEVDRPPPVSYEATMTAYLRDKYAERAVDAVIALGPVPLAFLSRHRASMLPGVPIIFSGVRDSRVRSGALPPGTTGVTGGFDLVDTVELAIALQPNAQRLFVLSGVAPLDLEWKALAEERLEAYRDRFDVTYLSGKPVALLLEELARLPRDSIVILLGMAEDEAGERFVAREIVGRISAASSAPVYGVYQAYVGAGVVGGYVDLFESMGTDTGELVARVLAGESVDDLPIRRAQQQFVVDSRQMRRWGLDESRLPAGTVAEFRPPTLWNQYRVEILGALALIALQTLVIIALLLRVRQRRAERALQETEDRYRNVVESQSDLICRYLPDTTLTFVNEAYCRYFGRSRDQLVGTKFVDLLPEAERQTALLHVLSLIARPRSEIYTHRVLRLDGAVGWQQWVDHAVVGADGSVGELQGVGRDITALKNAETEALQRREEVTHLTRVAILGELSGALAHELNQPLTAILSNAQAAELLLARDEIDREELRAILRDIALDDARAGEVIKRLRDLLKRGRSDFQPLDINALVNEGLVLARAQLVAHHVQIASHLAPGIPASRGDRVQLLQVILNLLINACEAMEANEPADRTLVVKTSAHHDFVTVSVIDSGNGLLPDVAARLFEPFYTTKPKGLGLGLSISRSIVTAHGGHLYGTNNATRGATFELRLPA